MVERVSRWEGLSAGGRLGLPAALVSVAFFLALPAAAVEVDSGTDKPAQEEDPKADDDSVEVSSENPPPDGAEEFGEPLLPVWEERERERGTIPRGAAPSSSSVLSSKDAFDARRRAGNVQGFAGVRPGLALDGSLVASLFYDDNPLLENSEDIGGENTAAWGYGVQPGLSLTHRSPRTVFQSVVRLSYDDFMSVEDDREIELGSFNQYGGIQLDTVGPRTRLNLFANVANGTTRTEVVEETGRVSDDRVLTYGGGGSLTYAASPRSEIQLFAASRRRDVETAQLSAFTTIQAGAAYRVDLTATDTAGLSAQYERVMFDAATSPDVEVVTAFLTWSHHVNYALSVDLEVGPQVVFDGARVDGARRRVSVPDEETALDFFARAAVHYAASEWDRFTFSASRSAGPSVTGDVRMHNRIEAAYDRRISRDVSFRLPVSLSIQGEVFDDGSDSRSLLSVAPELIWAWTPVWGLSVQYRYRMEDEEGRSNASSNQVTMSLRYLGQLLP